MEIDRIFAKLKNRTPDVLGHEKFYKYAVLLPLIKKEGELHILFEVRSMNLRRQPGEICFPGGKIDSTDRDECHTAVRETSEELGIPEGAVRNIVPLDYMVSPFGTIIYPFAGTIINPDQIKPNESEVGEVFTVPVSYLLSTEPERFSIGFKPLPEEGFPFNLIAGGENYNWQTMRMEEVFYQYDGKVIWGLTARVLQHFLGLLRQES